ncbi:MAG: bifunctional UDP-N-acetylglucosamine diphosphorylase/glucosamine-1-phosphate N-acetyltransferase GlmU [bacterium]|nr:bifunctional UDP-N-acetylglucosamine diphosphorylase/glucosamine-1-phosphate N-acetyltransferase GlmU [bacterium]
MHENRKSDLEVIVLAAGKGTRMCSRRPKVLHSVCGRSMVERVARAVAGISTIDPVNTPARIVFVVGYCAEEVEAEISRLKSLEEFQGIELLTVLQSEQKGTGHAVQVAMPQLGKEARRVLILPGDVPLLCSKTLSLLFASAPRPLSVMSCEHPEPLGFGRILRNTSGEPYGIVEHRDASEAERQILEINSGIYLAEKEFLSQALSNLESNNAQGELYLTDIVSFAAREHLPVEVVLAPSHIELSGANSIAELSELEEIQRKRIIENHMNAGVTFVSPNQVVVDEGVKIGADTLIGLNSRLLGDTVIGAGVLIEGDGLIVDSTVADGARLLLGCYIEASQIDSGCVIGPYAHLRPGTRLESGVKIGNFVETKKSLLRRGSKVNHLSYIGDAEVGEDANVGAGTITCNYDGLKKSRTIIGAKAFIGSNTSLVAPVEVGPGAIVGAGSVVTKNVPENALAVTRAEQRNISGWALQRKRK